MESPIVGTFIVCFSKTAAVAHTNDRKVNVEESGVGAPPAIIDGRDKADLAMAAILLESIFCIVGLSMGVRWWCFRREEKRRRSDGSVRLQIEEDAGSSVVMFVCVLAPLSREWKAFAN
jgi:hypothetical protein